MAALAASLVYWPAAIVMVLFFSLAGVSAEALVTLGGTLGVFTGMLAWWSLLFVVILPCVMRALPWNLKLDGFRQRDS